MSDDIKTDTVRAFQRLAAGEDIASVWIDTQSVLLIVIIWEKRPTRRFSCETGIAIDTGSDEAR